MFLLIFQTTAYGCTSKINIGSEQEIKLIISVVLNFLVLIIIYIIDRIKKLKLLLFIDSSYTTI